MSLKKKPIPFFLFFLCIVLIVTVPSFAASGASGFLGIAENMVDSIFDTSALTEMTETLTMDVSQTYPALWELLEDLVENTIIPIAYGLSGIYLVLAFINVGVNEQQATVMQFLRPLVYFFVAMVLIQYTMTIVNLGISYGSGVAQLIVDSATESIVETDIAETTMQYIENHTSGIVSALTFVLQLFIPWVLKFVTNIAMQFFAWAAILELYVRAVMMPLSYGPMILSGFSMEGTRYIRAFLAACFRMSFLVIISLFMTMLMSACLTTLDPMEYASNSIKILVIELSAITLMSHSGKFANDLFAVH